MLFMFNPTQARQLAAVADAASKDGFRPAIASVLLTYEFDSKRDYATIKAVATDSYVLAIREIRLNALAAAHEDEVKKPNQPTSNKPGQVLLEAKDWKATMKAAAAAAKFGEVEVEVKPDRTEVTVSVEINGKLEYRHTLLPRSEHSFPDWEKLIPEHWIEEGELTLPNLDPTKLVQLAGCISTLPSDRKVRPWRLRASAGSDTNGALKPWGFVIPHSEVATDDGGDTSLVCLIMPVRV